MEEKIVTAKSKKDSFIWVFIVALIAAGVVASYYFRDYAWALRFMMWLALTTLVVVLVAFTSQGKRFWVFLNNAKLELKRVVWPTRDETIKTTAVVAALVFVMSIVLWVIDSILMWIFGWFMR